MDKRKKLLITGLTLGMLSFPKVVVSPVQNVNLEREIFTDKFTLNYLVSRFPEGFNLNLKNKD